MKASQLLGVLQGTDPDKKVKYGFDNAHPYALDPYGAAFMPCENTTVSAMIWAVRQVTEQQEEGSQLDGSSECYIANPGKPGETIGLYYLAYALELDPILVEALMEAE